MKNALVTFGNEESYGLLFVASELLKFKQEIKFFDSEESSFIEKIKEYKPDFAFFSPMTTFFPFALKIAKELKDSIHDLITVFGGHHISGYASLLRPEEIDIAIIGPIKGAVEQILSRDKNTIKTIPTTIDDLGLPARKEYYRDIPRMRNRYRKIMLSQLGCPFSCTYCASSAKRVSRLFDDNVHKEYFLKRRSISTIINEAEDILNLGSTAEIEFTDDDIFVGNDAEAWLSDFIDVWKKKINLPMYVLSSSISILNVSDKILEKLRQIVNCICLGVQAVRTESLKIFNRNWDNEKRMKAAYDRCVAFGFSVNMAAIIGLPVSDPVEDAIDTIEGLKRIGKYSICSVYPLQIYPNTAIEEYCKEHQFKLNDLSTNDTNTGIPSILFSEKEIKQIKNLCKLATLIVKYNIDERWIRVLMNIDFDQETSFLLSRERYRECIIDRLKDRGKEIFEDVINNTKLRY